LSGPSGVVNVGSLNVSTASSATLDRLVSANGSVNTSLANQLIHGDVPLSASGSVIVRGEIVARHGVVINAHDVSVAGSLSEAAKVARQRALFDSSVNDSGMPEGGAIVVRNGGIEIVASHSVQIGGSLTAGGSSHHGGSVSIAAASDVTIGSSAKIAAKPAVAGVSNSHVAKVSITAGQSATIKAHRCRWRGWTIGGCD